MKIPKIFISSFALLLAVSSLFFCTSCSRDKDSVRLANEQEIKQYVAKKFGEAVYIDKEFEQYKRTFRFRDAEYGFEYKVNSCVSTMSLDGSVFGYNESKTSNFADVYGQYISDCLQDKLKDIENDYGIQFDIKVTNDFLSVMTDEPEQPNMEVACGVISQAVREIDHREYFDTISFYLKGKATYFWGKYVFDNNEVSRARDKDNNLII